MNAGEHSFVRHESIVNYRLMKVYNEVRSTFLEAQSILKMYEPVSDALLARIQRGALESRFSVEKARNLIRSILEAPADSG